MEYIVEPFAGTDLSPLAPLHNHLVPMAKGGNLRYLQWKYQENPYVQQPRIAIVRSGSEIVAMRGLLGGAWHRSSGSTLETIPYVDDLIVHPDHRNRGLFVLLNRQTIAMATDAGFPAVLNVSGGPVTQSLSIASGWTEVRALERAYLIRPGLERAQPTLASKISSKAQGAARRLGYQPVARTSHKSVEKALGPVGATDSHITVSAEPRIEAMSNLAAEVGRHSSSRTGEYLHWRLRNPDRIYRFLYWGDPEIRGYVVLAWTNSHDRCLIIDHCATDEAVFDSLMTAASTIRSATVELMLSTIPEDRQETLYRLGFQDDPENLHGPKRRFLLYPIDGEKAAPQPSISAAAETWRMDLMDTMQG